MDVPSSLHNTCSECGEESYGRVVKGRIVGKFLKAVVKCGKCGHVQDVEVKIPKLVKIRTIISNDDQSEKTQIELADDWEVRLGDEIMVGETCVQVTGIEAGEKRVEKARVLEIKTLWTRYFNEIPLKIAINKGRKTVSIQATVLPEDEFSVGETITVGRRDIKIYRIKVAKRTLSRDGAKAMAKDIVRVYGRTTRPGKGE